MHKNELVGYGKRIMIYLLKFKYYWDNSFKM